MDLPISVLLATYKGVAEAVARTFVEHLPDTATPPRVFHLLPADFDPVDYGKTIFVGDDVCVRREILGRVSNLYLVVEGGPGTKHEAAVAMAQNATLVPVGRSGGCVGALYSHLKKPKFASDGDWQILGRPDASPGTVASAVIQIVKACCLQS